jgi:hypothetical protein
MQSGVHRLSHLQQLLFRLVFSVDVVDNFIIIPHFTVLFLEIWSRHQRLLFILFFCFFVFFGFSKCLKIGNDGVKWLREGTSNRCVFVIIAQNQIEVCQKSSDLFAFILGHGVCVISFVPAFLGILTQMFQKSLLDVSEVSILPSLVVHGSGEIFFFVELHLRLCLRLFNQFTNFILISKDDI